MALYADGYVPYMNNPDIAVIFELNFGRDVIKPGSLLKMKNMRGIFKFRCLAHNKKLDSSWVDVWDTTSGEFRSFRLEKIKGLVKPKKSRRKKSQKSN